MKGVATNFAPAKVFNQWRELNYHMSPRLQHQHQSTPVVLAVSGVYPHDLCEIASSMPIFESRRCPCAFRTDKR